ncbi:type IV secretory system conjugative DNA transfer family protein [Paracoccus sp. CPCC 101403]|uniref:Type IV secretory system conjugative DNA transfer family protein n=1 Tax=Paracoccus broussonetiae TaxID=3075834 RepID=A0ABU3EK69_9RHOB|nr:type IV secretory system conjugative DNA transfer family protein [Paracoccus sp. CPCC 101403]MDT1064654.1 type IV secretory system conjugative DNA transfer family protein [Paracoccus sp. CPCC 101403]
MIALIGRLFRLLVTLGVLAIAVPVGIVLLLFALGAGSGIGFLLFFLLRDLVEGGAGLRDEWPVTVLGWIGLALVLLPACALALIACAQYCGLGPLFTGIGRDSHGSARFSSRRERAALQRGEGLLIGRDADTNRLLRYDGPAHLITLAPTRAGKGVGTVIPNLLTANRSVLVIDPKGENARITARARQKFGAVHVLDPFGVTGLPGAAYNPLDRLVSDSPDLGEDAAGLAEALVMDPPGQTSEAHWNEEAKALLGGLIMFAARHEEPARRSLAAVRDYLTLPPERFRELLELMQQSDAAHGLIARAANRFLGKADREAASVLSNAQRHTHFLDSPRITAAMSRSDLRFAGLRHEVTSVFLVLPPNRLDAYSRWLRLLVAEALQDIARDAERPDGAERPQATAAALSGALTGPEGPGEAAEPLGGPSQPLSAPERRREPRRGPVPPTEPRTASWARQAPALFLLDEFAALGRLEAVERAMGLMAGYGIQLWPILQDLSQLKALYGARAGTFIANAGVQQVFGVNDLETAQWLSQGIGRETTATRSLNQKPGEFDSTTTSATGRDLLTPDEIMQLPPEAQLLRIQGQPITLARKLRYYADPEFRDLYEPQP